MLKKSILYLQNHHKTCVTKKQQSLMHVEVEFMRWKINWEENSIKTFKFESHKFTQQGWLTWIKHLVDQATSS